MTTTSTQPAMNPTTKRPIMITTTAFEQCKPTIEVTF